MRRPRLLLTRDASGCEAWARVLERAGVEPVSWPCLVHEELEEPSGGPSLVRSLAAARWLALTSPRGARAAAARARGLEKTWRVAAIGRETARAALGSALGGADLVARRSTGRGLAEELLEAESIELLSPVVHATSDRALGHFESALRAAGVRVLTHAIYATRPHPRGASRAKIPTADAALIASPSAFQGLIQRSRLIPSLPLITMGPTTSAAVEAAGYPVAAEAPSPNVEGLLAAYRELAREEAGRTEKAR